MANKEHLAILKEGKEAWNRWRQGSRATPELTGADISGANLRFANLGSANFRQANLGSSKLDEANLREANLNSADLTGADLSSADLTDADLSGANLDGADLTYANLRGANLSDANLNRADVSAANLRSANLRGASLFKTRFYCTILDGADLTNARAFFTSFTDCDLSKVKQLDLIKHEGPSRVGIDTIYQSNGKIPEGFLRGCGVPEGFITQMSSLVGAEDGIQFYSCFISYSTEDDDFARRLHGRMRDARLRVWFAPEDVQGGKKLHEQIETAIRIYDKLLIVITEASMASEWVMTELRKARKAERQSGKRKLFPVRLVDFETLREWQCFDADSGKDLAVELREYFIPDFSNWKDHDSFEVAFDRLLKDLRAEDRAAP